MYIIYFLKGYKILYFNFNENKRQKIILLVALVESILSIIFLYIIYFIPSFNNNYLFFTRNIIENLFLLVYMVKMFKENFIYLYRQYRVERRIRTRLTIAYKCKLILYTKVLIFTFFYCFGFIAMNIIQIVLKLSLKYNGFVHIYYLNIAYEMFFVIVIFIIFVPLKNSQKYFFTTRNKSCIKFYFINNSTIKAL